MTYTNHNSKSLYSLFKNLDNSWVELFKDYIHSEDLKQLNEQVTQAYNHNICYPDFDNILRCFQYFKANNTKAIILGQDPYHQPGQAEGLAFSVPKGIKPPPSLVNIYKELVNNNINFIMPTHGHLEEWAEQGVLLLNTTLTVEHNKAHSHAQIGWTVFTDFVIQKIAELPHYKAFLLWGNAAKQKKKFINGEQNLILEAHHPSPLSANRGGWFWNNHFIKTNQFLNKHKRTPIKWDITQ